MGQKCKPVMVCRLAGTSLFPWLWGLTLQWHHNGCGGVSNYQPHDCILNRLFRRRSKKTSKLRVTGLCAGNSPVTFEFPTQMARNAENASIWWRHREVRSIKQDHRLGRDYEINLDPNDTSIPLHKITYIHSISTPDCKQRYLHNSRFHFTVTRKC